MRRFNGLVVVAALCSMVAVTGCSWQRNKEAKETGRTPSQVATDKAISKRVADALKTAPVYKYPDVHVEAFNGNVQLSGFVNTEGQKEEAAQLAKQIPGVNEVRDDLVVQPLTPTGRTGDGTQGAGSPNKPYQAPVITPPQNEGAQQPSQVQPDQQVQPNQGAQPK